MSIMPLPGAKPLLSPLLLVPVTTAGLLAGCHAPVPGAPTRPLAVGLPCPARLPLQVAGSRRREPFVLPLFPRGPPGSPAHTHESSPAWRSVAPLPFAAPRVAADFCRRGKLRCPGQVLIRRRRVQCRVLLWPPWCIHQQK